MTLNEQLQVSLEETAKEAAHDYYSEVFNHAERVAHEVVTREFNDLSDDETEEVKQTFLNAFIENLRQLL